MNLSTEPLKPLLDNAIDKEKVFLEYLPTKTLKKLTNCSFYDDKEYDLYLDDTLFIIQKNNGKLYKQGKIISIVNKIVNKIINEIITVRTQTGSITINTNDYYLFTKTKKNNREFYKALLNNLK